MLQNYDHSPIGFSGLLQFVAALNSMSAVATPLLAELLLHF